MENRQKFCEFRRIEASEECSRICFIEKEKKVCVFGEEWCEEKIFCVFPISWKKRKNKIVLYIPLFLDGFWK